RLRRARGHPAGLVRARRDHGRHLGRSRRRHRADRPRLPAQHPSRHQRAAAPTGFRAHALLPHLAQRRREPGPALGAGRRARRRGPHRPGHRQGGRRPHRLLVRCPGRARPGDPRRTSPGRGDRCPGPGQRGRDRTGRGPRPGTPRAAGHRPPAAGDGRLPQHAHRPRGRSVHRRGRGRRHRRYRGRARAPGTGARPALSRRCAPGPGTPPVARRPGADAAVPALEAAAPRVPERRAALHRHPSPLDQLEDELTQAVATGPLAATVTTPHEGELMATTTATAAPSTPKELKGTLWKAADKLRGSMDASQYKDVVLGLVFLKYVSDAFEERREAIRAELAGEDADFIEETLEEVDEYTGSGVFWVAPAARWEYIAAHAKGT